MNLPTSGESYTEGGNNTSKSGERGNSPPPKGCKITKKKKKNMGVCVKYKKKTKGLMKLRSAE
jgi:hypothetical protein